MGLVFFGIFWAEISAGRYLDTRVLPRLTALAAGDPVAFLTEWVVRFDKHTLVSKLVSNMFCYIVRLLL